MITKSWCLHICLVMLFVTGILSQGCNQLRSKLQQANRDSLELLSNKMGTTVPLKCVDDIINFSSEPNDDSLPSIDEFQKEKAIVTIDEILQQITFIFAKNHSELTWDENSVKTFKLGLDQEIRELRPCLDPGMEDIRGEVKDYFARINGLLKDKKYSLCAWEIVQMEVRECLIVVNQLITRIPKKAPVSEKKEKETKTSQPCTVPASSKAKATIEMELPTVIDAMIEEEELVDTET